jgi:hypothetical protein
MYYYTLILKILYNNNGQNICDWGVNSIFLFAK